MKTDDKMMVWAWAGWEPAQFYRRLGGFHEAQEGNALWADDWFRQLESVDTAKALAEAGINWGTTHFYKGFGLKAEDGEIVATARLIANYHRHAIKVFTYIQYGSGMPEVISPVPQVGCARQRMPDGTHLLSLLNYGDEPVRGLEIRWLALDPAPDQIMAFDATGASCTLPVLKLGGALVCVRPMALDVELFVQV
jgi:hypothetical protein